MTSRRLAVALLAALAAPGCLNVLNKTELEPFGHEDPDIRWWLPLSTSFTERASRSRGRPQRRFESTTLFPFDLTFFRRMQFDAYDGQRVGETWGAVETPFFAWTFGEPVLTTDADGEPLPRFETWGMPLIFQWREVAYAGWHWEPSMSYRVPVNVNPEATERRLELTGGATGTRNWTEESRWQLGWDLGPSWASTSAEWSTRNLARVPGSAEIERATGTVIYPLKLAGLGGALWYSAWAEGPAESAQVHGPLWGVLGFIDYERTGGPGGSLDVLTLLGGLLWMSTTVYVDEPAFADDHSDEIWNAVHGPLWGMFGWGHDDGEPVIRLLWIPIPI